MALALLLVGFLTLLAQVTLLRELLVAFYGSELILLLALGAWLLFSAGGAAAGHRFIRQSAGGAPRRDSLQSAGGLRLLFLAFALAVPLSAVFIRGIRPLFAAAPGAYLDFPQQLIAMGIALLPVAWLSGLLFQWAAKSYVAAGRTLARAYAIESAGAVLGGSAATFSMRWGLQNLSMVFVCAIAGALAAFIGRRQDRRRAHDVGAAACGLLLLVALLASGPFDRALSRWSHPSLIDSLDTPYGRLTLTEQSGQLVAYVNDALAFETEGTSAEAFVHPAALEHPGPGTALVLGGAAEGLAAELYKHGLEAIDCVELDETAFSHTAARLPDETRRVLGARSLRLYFGDARRWLQDAPCYDLILIGMPEPSTGQANRYYTREFFRLCAEHLETGGILTLRLRLAENFWTPQQTALAASIHAALRAAFAETLVLPGAGGLFLASQTPLGRDTALLARRFEERKIAARLASPAWLRYVLTDDRVGQMAERLKAPRVPVNSDVRPICFSYTQLLWLSNFFPALAKANPGAPADWLSARRFYLAFLWILPPLVFLLIRRRRLLRGMLLVGLAALAGMVLENLLLLDYQMKSGILFQDLGLLLMLFMLGLAAGALSLDLASRRGSAAHRDPSQRVPRWSGFVLVLGLAGHSALLAALFQRHGAMGLAANGLLLMATGFLVAGVFAYAALREAGDTRRLVSPLYASDLLGGCMGAMIGSLLLAPTLGLGLSAWGMALLSVSALFLL